MSRRTSSLGALIALVLFFFARPAGAHQPGLSRGEYVLEGDRVMIELSFAHRELATAIPALDEDHDGQLTAQELTSDGATSVLHRDLLARVELRSGGRQCAITPISRAIDGEDAVL